MKLHPMPLDGVMLIEIAGFEDSRGYLFESYQAKRYDDAGIRELFVQDNVSYSENGVLRGLHLQNPKLQGKLVYVLQGAVFDVAVDVRVGSPNFGRWTSAELTAQNRHQMYIPPGFAHGFCVTSESALFAYKCTDFYDPTANISIAWNDPSIGIDWPVSNPSLSQKDMSAPPLDQIDTACLPKFDLTTAHCRAG